MHQFGLSNSSMPIILLLYATYYERDYKWLQVTTSQTTSDNE